MAKLTVNVSSQLDEVIDQLARARDLPKTAVLRNAVMLMRFLDQAAEDGRELLLRDRETGQEQLLVFESSIASGTTY
jgi:predicted transcriptional regulator